MRGGEVDGVDGVDGVGLMVERCAKMHEMRVEK